MTKHKKIIIATVSVLLCTLLLAVLFIALKKRVFPALNDYKWSYEQEFIDEHDSDMVIDGKLDEARWSGQKWLTHSDNGVSVQYTTVFTDYGLYVGAVVDDDDLQWNKRFNFAKYTPDASNSAFHFRISHSDEKTATTFNCYNFYVDTQDSASRNQTRHEAKSSLNGVLNPKEEETKATQMTAELFVSWEALHLEDKQPKNIRIYPEYRYVKGESSEENMWIKPMCYEEGTTRMFLSALFDKNGYINADEEGALLGDSKTGMCKSDGWDISKANKGKVAANDYYQQNIFYKEIFSDAYIYSTTMKITGEQENEVGYAGIFDATDTKNVNVFYISARGVLEGSDTLTMQMLDYDRWETQTIGTIPNKAEYKTKGIPLTVIKDDTHMYYLVDGNLVHSEDVSFISGKSSPGLFTLRASAEYEDCRVIDYSDKKDELKKIISKYVYSVEIEGKISGGSVTADVSALPKGGKTAGEDLTLSILADNGYILTELTIKGTNNKSSDYLTYATKNMNYGSLVIPKESIIGDVVISAKFTSITKAFDKDSIVILSGVVTNAVGAKQSAKIVIHNKDCASPLLSSITQSGVTGAFDVYLLKKGTYTIGNGVTIKSDGKYVLGASNSGYVTEYVDAVAGSTKEVNIVLSKNKVTSGYRETGDGGYQSISASAHNHFVDGIGKAWTANLTLPALEEGQQAGYVLHLAEPDITWTNWIRVAAVVKDGKLNVLTHMNVDNEVYAQKYYDTGIDDTHAEGKVLHLLLEKGKLNCYLDNKLIFVYTDFSVINDYTVSQVLSLNDKVACGLYNNRANVVLRQFSFTTENVPQGEVLHQVSGTVTATTDAMRRFQIVVTDTKTGNIYVTQAKRDGSYSIKLPSGQYRFTLKHSSQDKFFYPMPVEKNLISVGKSIDNVNFTAKPITASVGTFNCKLNIPLIDVKSDEFKVKLNHKSYGEFTVYRNRDGSFTTNAPVGTYTLSVKHKTETLFTENEFNVTIKKGDNSKTVTLKKNAITNGSYVLTENLYYQSNGTHRHNMFEQAYGKVWEANLEIPELKTGERVGFVIHKYKNNAVVWGNWFRLFVGKTEDGKLELVSQICADKTVDAEEINVTSSRVTDIDADSVAGKKLQVVYKDGVLTLRLAGQILNLYTNDSYLASEGKSTQVKNVLDLNGELACGLLTSHKDMIIKDWAFTNVKENVSANPVLNGTLKGKVKLSIDTLGLNQVRLVLHSKDGKMSLHTYASKDGAYEIQVPAGEYRLEVANDGVAAYNPYAEDVSIRKWGTTKNVTLDKKNAINNTAFTLTKEEYFESTKRYVHNSFVNGYGDVWEANLKMPDLKLGESVGFVIHKYENDAFVWGNWMRLMVEKTEDGKLEVVSQICADKTGERAEINVTSRIATTVDADDAAGKLLQAVYNEGILTLRLDGQILNLYTNDTYLASEGKATQVKNVLDLTKDLACGLLTNTKGMVIQEWAFTNIEKNVPSNPKLNGTLSGKVKISINTMGLDQVRLTLRSTNGKTSFQTYASADGTYEIKAPAGKYVLEVSNDGVASYIPYEKEVKITQSGTELNIVLDAMNAIHNNAFTLTDEGYFESTKGYVHNSFVNGYGNAWEASLEMPELKAGERVGFVIVKCENGDYAWGNWFRLMVERTKDGKLQVVSHVGADKTVDREAINVTSSRPTDINADDVIGKKLQAVYKDGILTLRLEGQILNLYTNDTYLASEGKSTQVKDVLDLTGELWCGLLTNTKGMVIKEWAFTNIKKNVSDNPTLNGSLSGQVNLLIDTVGLDQVCIVLHSETEQMSFHTYANADGTYEIKAPASKYQLEVLCDAYVSHAITVEVTEEGTVQDIALTKNAMNSGYEMTEAGAYKSTVGGDTHGFFKYGYGTEWSAEMTMPELTNGQKAGFGFIKYNGVNDPQWGTWLRVAVLKTSEGLHLFVKTNVDKKPELQNEFTYPMSGTSVEGKQFKVTLKDGKLAVSLDGKEIYRMTNATALGAGKGTLGDVFKLGQDNIYCGLYVDKKGTEIKDWSFTNLQENLPSTPTYNATLSGKVQLSVNTLNVNLVHLELSNASGTYATYAYLDGTYEINAPAGEYQLTVTNDGKATYIPYEKTVTIHEGENSQDVVLNKKNAIQDNSFELTEAEEYKSTAANRHNYFVNGYGAEWSAEMMMPELGANEAAGFVLHKRGPNGEAVWGNWMRLYVLKNADGTLQLRAHMNVDGKFNTECGYPISETSVGEKAFKVVLLDGELVVSLDDKVLCHLTNDTELVAGKGTVGEVLGLSEANEVYCGLFVNKAGIVVKEWSFTNVLDTSKKYTVSGTVSAGLAGTEAANTTLTFVNKADETKTYTVKPDADGKYSVQLPSAHYKVTASHADYVNNTFECSVLFNDATKDICLRKNKINNAVFTVTEEGYYKSVNANNTIFIDGYGSVWEAELEVPNLTAGQGVGFVFHKGTNNSISWGSWMRILLVKASNGDIQLYSKMHVDGNTNLQADKTVTLSETSVEGKTLQVSMLNGKIVVTLEGKVIATYANSTKLSDDKGIIGDVLGLSGTDGVYCGLLANKADIVITDWAYTNVLDISKEYTVSGTVSVGLAGAKASDTTLTFVNEADATKTYTVKPDADGKYSVQLPSAHYKVMVSHADYVNNTFECSVLFGDVSKDICLRKNKINNAVFSITEEGYYRSENANNTIFKSGYGSVWEAELEIPNLTAGQGVGFVFHKGTSNSITWGSWMRILLVKANNGDIQLYTKMHVDGNTNLQVDKTITLSEKSVEGKTLQVSLLNNEIVVTLEGKVIATYKNSTKLVDNKGTVGDVLGLSGTNGVYCGLLANKAGIVITDWSFINN